MENNPDKIGRPSCPSCGGWNEYGNQFCTCCGKTLTKKKRIRLSKTYIFVGTILVTFAALFFFWINSPESREIGKVNGERISCEESSKRIARAKKFYEY